MPKLKQILRVPEKQRMNVGNRWHSEVTEGGTSARNDEKFLFGTHCASKPAVLRATLLRTTLSSRDCDPSIS